MATVLVARMETMLPTPTPGLPTRAAREGAAGRRGFRRPGSTVLVGIVLLACAATLLPAQGRQPFERLSLADGLSQSIVEGILQDRKGFMWFVTEDGLNRHDGYRFTVLRNQADNSNSLSHNELKTIYEDREGILWIGTFEGGLNRFDPSTGQFTRFRPDPADPASLGAGTVRCILEDRSGELWIGTQGGGLDRLDRLSWTFTHFRFDPGDPTSLSSNDVRALHEDRDGTLWVGTNGGGLNRLDRATGRFTRFAPDPSDPRALPHGEVLAILEDRLGVLWIGTYGGGLCTLDRSTGAFTRLPPAPGSPGSLPSPLVRGLLEDHAGALWVATEGGLARIEPGTRTVTVFHTDPLGASSLSSDRVWSLHEDRSHVLWIGTYGGGLSKLDLERKPFRHITSVPGDSRSLSHPIVWSTYEDPGGTLWVGTDAGGLNRLDPSSGAFRHYRHDPGNPTSLAHDTVRVITPAGDGTLWIGTHGGGLDRLDPRTGRFTHHRHDPADPGSLAHDELRAVLVDRSGATWVATYGGGLDRLDPGSRRFVHHRNDPRDPASLSHDFVRCLVEDPSGDLWIGTDGGGLNRLDRAKGTFAHYRASGSNRASLGNDHVFAVLVDRSGTLWVGTYGGGLDRLDRATGTFTHVTVENGLASNAVYGLLEDPQGRIWISTNNGLSRLDPRDGAVHSFDVQDGLPSNELNGGSCFSSPRGELFFGGINGLSAFVPEQIRLNPLPPPVAVTDLQLFNRSVRPGDAPSGRPILTRPIEHTDAIELSHRDQVVSFEFAALHFTAPRKNQYAYTLDGFHEGWIPTRSDRRFATFTGLAPGRYVFRVKASNSDGVWNETGAAVAIVVTPPFWGTWWFRLAAVLVLAGLALAVARRRLRNVRLLAELHAAHDTQMAIMPAADPRVDGFEVSGVCLPAHEVGGDFFDYFRTGTDEGQLCIAVGDVSGKAMKAAMMAVLSNGMLWARAGEGSSLDAIMNGVNRSLHTKIGRRMFTALCLASVDRDSRRLAFVNAGLCEPLHASGGLVRYLPSTGPTVPLGVFPDTVYETTELTLEPGDVLVLFSDGLPEARNRSGEQLGYDAMADLVRRLDTSLPAARLKEAIVREVAAFSAGSHQQDDIALVVVKVL
ncbi:MAG: SpoIIE family protein phosphatase [Thermoanaerobaculaceae bacterium]|nr:SpoIIE family protein phosphatase [Thermoanaerobaculaceae bacterium]